MVGVKYIEDDGTVNLSRNIESIDDLITLGSMYRANKRYNINLKKIRDILGPLRSLQNMIGLSNIKNVVVNQILYFLQNFHEDEMLHTIIQGPPGVGKTMLAKIIGEIYHKMNIFGSTHQDYKFVVARRSDLIGEYLGTTAKKTQKVIDSCKGGVLFIDEAYSLGNSEGRDSYSKECIDTINQNLSEKKGEFLCIIAGYQDSLEKSFFNYNQGLSRRFPFVYTLGTYNAQELTEILSSIFARDRWECDSRCEAIRGQIERHYKEFTNMAGDMETLALNTKLAHCKRVFFLHHSLKKKINHEDLKKGIEEFLNQKKSKQKDSRTNAIVSHMYL